MAPRKPTEDHKFNLFPCSYARLYNRQGKTRVLVGTGKFVIKVQTNDVMNRKVLRAKIMTTEIFKNISNFVRITDIKTMYKINRCTLIRRGGRQNVLRTSVTLLACGSWRTSLFLQRFDVTRALSEYTKHGQMESTTHVFVII